MAWRKAPPALIALFDRALPSDGRIERRPMFGYPAAFVHGNLCAGLHQESFILRLPEADRERLRVDHGAQVFEPMAGRRMREYVVVPEALLADRPALGRWVARAVAYAASLPPKRIKPKRTRER